MAPQSEEGEVPVVPQHADTMEGLLEPLRSIARQKALAIANLRALEQEAKNVSEQISKYGHESDEQAGLLAEYIREELCKEMPHILPPELRDMVYDYVLGPATEQHIRPSRSGARLRQIDEINRDIVPHPNERIWMIGYNGIGIRGFDWGRQDILQGIVARELTEQWYQRHPFLFYAEELYLLSNFLDRAFALRIPNPRDFIKDLKIQIWDEDKPALDTLSSDLQCLKEVKNKDMKLSFDLWPTDERNTELETLRLFLRLLNTAVAQLRGYGFHRIDVSWMRPQQDITCLFNLGDEQFEVVLAQIELGLFGARSMFDIIEHSVAWCE